MSSENKKMGVAIIGLGEYSINSLIPALQETEHCYLSALISDEEDKAKEIAGKNDVAVENIYSEKNFDSIKDNNSVQIIYIVVPNARHKEFTIRAAKAGKHIICEKPMGITVEDCDDMIQACNDAGVTLSIGYRLRFEPFNKKVMELGTNKTYGKIKSLTVKNGISDVSGWRLDKDLSGGGALVDVGVYCIQAVRYTTGMEPVSVKAKQGKTTNADKFKNIEESLTWKMKMPDGLVADCEASYTTDLNLLRAEAENGWFELCPAFAYTDIKGKTSDGEMKLDNNNQQAAELDSIAFAIKHKKQSPVPGEMGRQDVKIINAIYASMKSGEWINVEN